MSKIKFIVEKTNTGYSAYAERFPIATTGDNIPQVMSNAYEASSLYFEDERLELKRDDLRFDFDLKEFFNEYRIINSSVLARRIGMNESLLSQYVNGKKKMTPKQKERIINGINKIGRELSEISLIN